MSENFSKKAPSDRPEKLTKPKKKIWPWLLILPIWVYAAFWSAQLLVLASQWLLVNIGVSLGGVNQVVYTTTLSAIIYILAVAIVTLVPYLVWRRKTTSKELGMPDVPTWIDYLMPIPAFVVYIVCSGLLLALLTKLAPAIDLSQAQDLPFTSQMLGTRWQLFLAFLTLVVMAPIAEEILFRGYLHGKLRNVAPAWVAVLITALTFGLAHLWAGGDNLQWAVAIDTFALGLILSIMREYTGAIWASIVLHAIKNGLAFYLLFVNPDIVNQIKAAILPML